MKKFILSCFIAYASTAVAQDKLSISIADLIESKRFVFVVNDIEKKPGFNGVSGYAPYVFTDSPNPSAMTVRQSYNVTSLPVNKDIQRQYYKLSQSDGSYFEAHNLSGNKTAPTVEDKDKQIYLSQNDGAITISESKNPKSVAEIQISDNYVLAAENYKMKSSKKSDGSVTLKYTLKSDNQKQTFYLNVDKEGDAVLIQQPTKEFTTYMYGKIEQLSL